jgi:hypothetical protein
MRMLSILSRIPSGSIAWRLTTGFRLLTSSSPDLPLISTFRAHSLLSRFPKGFSSGVKSIRKRVIGQGEFSLYQVMSSAYDLREAVSKFRFVLLPQVPPSALFFSTILAD